MTDEDQETSGESAELLELIIESSTDFAIFTTDLIGHANTLDKNEPPSD